MRMDLRLEVLLTLMSRGPDHTILEIQLGLQCHVVFKDRVYSIPSDRCLLEGHAWRSVSARRHDQVS